ncbi:Subtilisin NAT [Colletotrichum sidae]|uniref:Subtilisin NAT n=1 Tax=Colletotrichum sidae TaxID=1347389 RepID=A0A4R8TUT9_9PEZI|nr:Subtilisin NAT [Colletotrichum sidae]
MVDTGVDYLHPALGEGFGEGHQVRYGMDFVGDDWEFGDPPRVDEDPYSECMEHGTHISGIAAGNDSSTGFFGAAPGASLEHYRVTGCRAVPIQSDIVIKAVLMAYSRNVDVISLSFTTNTGPYPDDALSEVLSRISQEGKVLVVVASGAHYVLIYNDDDQSLFDFENNFEGVLGAGSVNAELGSHLIGILATGSQIKVMMDSNFTAAPYIRVGKNSMPPGQVNGRGSWGPSGLGDGMPSILAPGQSIWSTLPRSWGGYGSLSGTSMAAPYIAGCAALVKQVHPNLTSSEITRLLMNTAKPLAFNDGTNKTYDFLAPVAQQGNGVVNVSRAARSRTKLSKSHLAFNDTEFFEETMFFEVLNEHQESINYTIFHRPAVTVLTLDPNLEAVTSWAKDNTSALATGEFLRNLRPGIYANITITPAQMMLEAGKSARVRISANIKALADVAPRCPLYSGFIEVEGGKEQLTVSYGGIGCAMRKLSALPPGWNKTFITAKTANEARGQTQDTDPVVQNTTFHLGGHRHIKDLLNSSTLLPTLNLNLAMYSRAISVQALEAAAPETETGMAIFTTDQTARPGGFAREAIDWLGWSGLLTNGSWVERGSYKLKVCASRAWESTQDPSAKEDCSTTAPFSIDYEEGG